MMFKIIRYTFHFTAAVAVVGLYAGCTFDGASSGPTPESVNQKWESASLTQPYATNRQTVYGDALFQVWHGASCASANRAVSEDNVGNRSYGVGLNESMPIPAGYDTATVFLNGWRLKYTSKDHEVLGFSTAIVDIEQDGNELRWKAGGVLSDKNGDDAFAWCYYYTALLWNSHPLDLDAIPYDSDDEAGLTFVSTDNSDEGTSLQVEGNLLEDFDDVPGALLPRGFGVMWTSDDHHLMQFALKYGDPFIFTSEDGSGSDVWWQFETVFKDNKTHRHYYAAEVVSTLNGDSVDVIQPDFNLGPRAKTDCPNIGTASVSEETITVEDVPFDYAVPMLTGWDIGDICEDNHIKDIGVWIESFNYDKGPGASTGTLTYTIKSVFRDKGLGLFGGSIGAEEPRYQVSILGFNPKGIIITTPTTTTGTVYEDPLPMPTTTTSPAVTTGTTTGPVTGPVTTTSFGRANILSGQMSLRENRNR